MKSLRKVAPTRYTTRAEGNPDFGGIPAHTALTPNAPTFSPDGRWLAYLVPQAAGGAFSQLWIANGDGTAAHLVRRVAVDQLVGWSPTADVLAVITATRGRRGYPFPTGSYRSQDALQRETAGEVLW